MAQAEANPDTVAEAQALLQPLGVTQGDAQSAHWHGDGKSGCCPRSPVSYMGGQWD